MTTPTQKGIFTEAVKLANQNTYVGIVVIADGVEVEAKLNGKLLKEIDLSEIDNSAKLNVLVGLDGGKTYWVEKVEISYPKSVFTAELSHISVQYKDGNKRFEGKLKVQQGCFAKFSLFPDSCKLLSVTEQTVLAVKVKYQQGDYPFKFAGFSVKPKQLARCKVVRNDKSGVGLEVEYGNGAIFSYDVSPKALQIPANNGLAINFERNKTLTLPIEAYKGYKISVALTPKFGSAQTGAFTGPFTGEMRFTRYVTEQGREYALFHVDESDVEVKILSSEWLLFNIAKFKPGAVIHASIKAIDNQSKGYVNRLNHWRIIKVNSDLAALAGLPSCSMQKVVAMFAWRFKHNGHPFEDEQQKQLPKPLQHSAILQVVCGGKIDLAVFVTDAALSKNMISSIEQGSKGRGEITVVKTASNAGAGVNVVSVGKVKFDISKPTNTGIYSEIWVSLEHTKALKNDYVKFTFSPLGSISLTLSPYTDLKGQLSHFKTPNQYKYRVLLRNIGDQYFVKEILQLEKL